MRHDFKKFLTVFSLIHGALNAASELLLRSPECRFGYDIYYIIPPRHHVWLALFSLFVSGWLVFDLVTHKEHGLLKILAIAVNAFYIVLLSGTLLRA